MAFPAGCFRVLDRVATAPASALDVPQLRFAGVPVGQIVVYLPSARLASPAVHIEAHEA
jgi:hypothetical protein